MLMGLRLKVIVTGENKWGFDVVLEMSDIT